MKVFFFNLSVFFLILYTGCSNSHQKKISQEQNKADTIKPAKVYANLNCTENKEKSYALYLPNSYNKQNKYSIIVFFDPQGDASLPIKKYVHLADEYDLIFVGINNSKNGLELSVIQESYKTCLSEVFKLFNVDSNRVILSGFSGGARVAGILGLTESNIYGIIGCGAGFPENTQNIPSNFKYFGIVGDKDFNYLELLHTDSLLNHINIDHFVLQFSGKHEWPNENIYKEAIIWMNIRFLENGIKKSKLIADFEKRMDDSIVKNKLAILKQYEFLKQKIAFLSPIKNIPDWQNTLVTLEKNITVKEYQKKIKYLSSQEKNQQQVFLSAFYFKQLDWWNEQMNNLLKSKNSKNFSPENISNVRLLNFLSLVSYMNANKAITNNDTANANLFLQIYRTVDPENPEHAYLQAKILAKNGFYEQSFKYLETAVSLGFNDSKRLNEDNYLSPLKENPKYGDIITKIDLNKKSIR